EPSVKCFLSRSSAIPKLVPSRLAAARPKANWNIWFPRRPRRSTVITRPRVAPRPGTVGTLSRGDGGGQQHIAGSGGGDLPPHPPDPALDRHRPDRFRGAVALPPPAVLLHVARPQVALSPDVPRPDLGDPAAAGVDGHPLGDLRRPRRDRVRERHP